MALGRASVESALARVACGWSAGRGSTWSCLVILVSNETNTGHELIRGPVLVWWWDVVVVGVVVVVGDTAGTVVVGVVVVVRGDVVVALWRSVRISSCRALCSRWSCSSWLW